MSARNERLLNLLAESRLKEVIKCGVKKAINDALGGNCDNSENVMDIEFKNDSVCFADGRYWSSLGDGYSYLVDEKAAGIDFNSLINFKDFQLNTIKQGDCIEASELDEQKYNNVGEVFGLFGFFKINNRVNESNYKYSVYSNMLAFNDNQLLHVTEGYPDNKRKLTYPQLMAIGELKRLEIERDKEPQFGKSEDGSMKLIKSNFSASSNKYERDITDRQGNSAAVDVYDVLKAFEVTCPATQHALKKLLCSGLRGHKDLQTDLLEAKESITRAIELNE